MGAPDSELVAQMVEILDVLLPPPNISDELVLLLRWAREQPPRINIGERVRRLRHGRRQPHAIEFAPAARRSSESSGEFGA